MNVTLLGNRVFVDTIMLKWRSYQIRIRIGPKSNDCFPYKKMEIWTQKREDHVETEAEIGAMVLQAKIHLGPSGSYKPRYTWDHLEAGRGPERFFPSTSGGHGPANTLGKGSTGINF